jgi:hypothetical protein
MKDRILQGIATILVALLTAGVWVSTVEAQSPPQRDFNPRVLMKHLRPIVDAPFIPATKVRGQVADNELVLGVVVAGQPRAYPINMLTGPSREIINDQLGGRAIAATW